MRFRDVRGGFRARVIYQMKEEMMGNIFMVVDLMTGRRWCPVGGVWPAAAKRGEGRGGEVEDKVRVRVRFWVYIFPTFTFWPLKFSFFLFCHNLY